MSSPFTWPALEPDENDPVTFRYFFPELIRHHLPCQDVELIPVKSGDVFAADLSDESRDIVAHVKKKGKPVIDSDAPRLFLPLLVGGELYAIAILEGGKKALYEKFTIKALLDGSQAVTDDFLALRARAIDPLTGLFNSILWRETMAKRLADPDPFCLVLLEIYPRARDAAHAHSYLQRAAGALDSMVGKGVPLFHLGSGIFAMLWEVVSPAEVQTLADVMLYRLQRDGMARAHLGQVWSGEDAAGFDELMERAWQSVVKARQRGPFAKAVHMSAADLNHHPFRPLSPPELNRFKNCWKRDEVFAIAALQCDRGDDGFAETVREQLDERMSLVEREDGGLYLYLYGLDHDRVGSALDDLRKRLPGRSFSAGVATFPFGDFKRSAVILNARKALQHTSFFDAGSTTFFDAVSLNVSGDVYYNDGDMNGAVREYLLGLELDGASVNLLNSLGVAYVRLNGYKTAIKYFTKVLDIEPGNYMALFNLGSAWLTHDRDDLAVGFLEKALGVDDSIFDLFLQLAELYCRSGRYEKVVELLCADGEAPAKREEWENAAALRCLGEAWRNLGENSKAMECLQRASAFNPRDSRALSLLGEVYDVEGQGADIALSLGCEAVELDDKWDNWLRLGQIQFRNGHPKEALGSLQRSMKLKRCNIEAARILKKLYEDGGKTRLAAGMAEKIRKIDKPVSC